MEIVAELQNHVVQDVLIAQKCHPVNKIVSYDHYYNNHSQEYFTDYLELLLNNFLDYCCKYVFECLSDYM